MSDDPPQHDPPGGLRRRALLEGGLHAGAAVAMGAMATSCGRARPRSVDDVPVTVVGQDPRRGHQVRDALRATAGTAGVPEVRCQALVVGAGVAGTCAAWHLRRRGVDVRVVELEPRIGGTAAGDSLGGLPHPLGAHYLPAPQPDQPELIALLDELGMVAAYDEHGLPEWHLPHVLAAPLERHFFEGRWFPGLFPAWRASADDLDQWARWHDHLAQLDARGWFRLPARASDPRAHALDRQSMASYLDELGITSWRVRWTVAYACIDDYGCALEDTSAFAGLHHYLCRGYEEVHDRDLLAFPEGNAGFVARIAERAGLVDASGAPTERLVLDTLVRQVDATRGEALTQSLTDGRQARYRADWIVWAAPSFILPHVLADAARLDRAPALRHAAAHTHAPWMVANLHLDAPLGGFGAARSWDNVPVNDDNLGYVSATHGRATDDPRRDTVVTFYRALTGSPSRARKRLLDTTPAGLRHDVLSSMARMHPSVVTHTRAMTVARWGHGMVRPTVGALFGADSRVGDGPALRAALASGSAPRLDRLLACATDVGGLALFEEAFHAARTAALIVTS